MWHYLDSYYAETAYEYEARRECPEWEQRPEEPILMPWIIGWVGGAGAFLVGLSGFIAWFN